MTCRKLIAWCLLSIPLVVHAQALSPRECVRSATELFALLKPQADLLAGRVLQVKPPAAVTLASFSTAGVDESIGTRGLTDGKTIEITSRFCRQTDSAKLATLAHELGHVVDYAIDPKSWDSTETGDWNLRPREIQATRYAAVMLEALKKQDVLLSHYGEAHLSAAGIFARNGGGTGTTLRTP